MVLTLGAYFSRHGGVLESALALWPFVFAFAVVAVGLPLFMAWLCRARSSRALVLTLSSFGLLTVVLLVGVSVERMVPRLIQAGTAGLILLAALCVGVRLRGWILPALVSPPWRLLYGVGLGLGSLSLLTLLIGRAGMLKQPVCISLLLVLVAVNLRVLIAEGRALAGWRRGRAWSLGRGDLVLVGCLCLGLLLSLPAAFLPPLDYDVTEYHAQLPREYVRDGVIDYRPNNAFSAMPQNMEMLTTLAMGVQGGREGWPAAKLIHWALLPLILAAAMAGAYRMAGRRAALLTGLLLLAMPIVSFRAATLYVELGLCFYGLLALSLLHPHEPSVAGSPRSVLVIGLLLGFAAGTKYPALLFMATPIGLLLLLPGREGGWGVGVRRVGWLVLGWAIAFGPWLLRNWIEIGNPLAPIWNEWFGVEGWSAVLEERFRLAHRPSDFTGKGLWEAVQLLTLNSRELLPAGWMLLGAVPVFLLAHRGQGRREMVTTLFVAGAGVILWFLFTHRLERFILFSFLLMAQAGAVACARPGLRPVRWLAGGAAIVLNLLVWLVVMLGLYFPFAESHALSVAMGREPAATLQDRDAASRMGRQLATLPAGSRVLLFGSATPFHMPDAVEYGVVFSVHPLERWLAESGSAELLAKRLRQEGITHLVLNWSELARLHATYHRAYAFTPREQHVLREFFLRYASPSRPLDYWTEHPARPPRLWPPMPKDPRSMPPWMAQELHMYERALSSPARARALYGRARPGLSVVLGQGGSAAYLERLWQSWSDLLAPQGVGVPSPVGRFPHEIFALKGE
ncbi:MAG: hypothetical protein ACYTGH_05955 [Planctomycetota bacterium]